MRNMTRTPISFVPALLFLGLAATAAAQQTSQSAPTPATHAPVLQQRSADNSAATTLPMIATGQTDLPDAAQGSYPWSFTGKPSDSLSGNRIEIYFEDGKLHGYMTERIDSHADPQAEQVAPMVFDFATTHIEGSTLKWTTRQVHGHWFSFVGRLERGSDQTTTAQSGYYLLIGMLTLHQGASPPAAHRVSLKREPDQG